MGAAFRCSKSTMGILAGHAPGPMCPWARINGFTGPFPYPFHGNAPSAYNAVFVRLPVLGNAVPIVKPDILSPNEIHTISFIKKSIAKLYALGKK